MTAAKTDRELLELAGKVVFSLALVAAGVIACAKQSAPATASEPETPSPTPVYLIAKSGGYRVDTFRDGENTCYVMFRTTYGYGHSTATSAISCVRAAASIGESKS